jgi:hypothetical protein
VNWSEKNLAKSSSGAKEFGFYSHDKKSAETLRGDD